jgi:5-(carboxyamino)imidazole ribonucleotide synthase
MLKVLKPGDTIGILGGGQLGRMLALAGAALGLKSHILAPEADSPAFQVAADSTQAGYRDEAALAAFAASVDAVTYEFENVPVETVRFLEARVPVRPGSAALAVAQDRLAEKALARRLGAQTAVFASVGDRAELDAAIAAIGLPAILKTTRLGYDGKGQAKITSAEDADAAFAAMSGAAAVLEGYVPFRLEASVVAARALDGAFAPYAVTQNEHRNHILHRSVAPAALGPETARAAIEAARAIGEAMAYVGVFAVEFFIAGEGAAERVIVNEIAPRVHNSGHWTDGGAVTSQFSQHMRAVAGWPLGSPALVGAGADMLNLIGDEAEGWRAILADPEARLHLYGKAEARPGRKMGHVNRITPIRPPKP